MHRWLVLVVALIAVALSGRPACAQGSEVLAHYGTSPETLADVILVLKPDATFPLDVPIPTERVISGSILRIDKGAAPQRIVHTPKTIVSRLRAGVPTKLFLKAFPEVTPTTSSR